MKWYDRILVAASGVLLAGSGVFLLLAGLGAPRWVAQSLADVAAGMIGPTFANAVRTGQWYMIVLFLCIGLLLLAWGLRLVALPFLRQHREAYFAAPDVKNGSLQISLQALEHLIAKSLARHPQLTETKIHTGSSGDGIRVQLRTVMQTGTHIPQVTQEVREDITNYLMTCAGVRVSDVDIVVEDTKPGPDIPELQGSSAAERPAEAWNVPAQEEITSWESRAAEIEATQLGGMRDTPQEATPYEKMGELDIEAELAKVDAEGESNA